jgi:hypothetical protein
MIYLSVSVCVCMCMRPALLIQHATSMNHTVTSFVAPLAPLYFSTLSHKRHDFRGGKKKLLGIKCVVSFSLQIFSETFHILWRIYRDIVINVKAS